jgi:hypothetical protein
MSPPGHPPQCEFVVAFRWWIAAALSGVALLLGLLWLAIYPARRVDARHEKRLRWPNAPTNNTHSSWPATTAGPTANTHPRCGLDPATTVLKPRLLATRCNCPATKGVTLRQPLL